MNKTLPFLILSSFLMTGYLSTQAQTQFWSDNFEDTGASSAGIKTSAYTMAEGTPAAFHMAWRLSKTAFGR